MITPEQLDELERLRDKIKTAPFPRDSDWACEYFEALAEYMPALIAAARECESLRKMEEILMKKSTELAQENEKFRTALENYEISVDFVLNNPGRDYNSLVVENDLLRTRLASILFFGGDKLNQTKCEEIQRWAEEYPTALKKRVTELEHAYWTTVGRWPPSS